MHSQRRNPELFAEGLEQWRCGVDSEEAEAARVNVAALLNLVGQYLTDGGWGK